MHDPDDRLASLITVRDWLRYGVSRFEAAALAYGHGTSRALDEAAFLILAALELPIDELEPWLDARLLPDERRRIARLLDDRVATRKPAPYLVNRAYIRGRRFYVDERTIVPRSYIGELLCDVCDNEDGELIVPLLAELSGAGSILDLCTGGGSLAILAALAAPTASIDAVDLSPDALAVARRNVDDYGLGDRISLIRSDLFAALSGRRYDLILSNPPYVPEDRVAAFPPEHAAEPHEAHAGGADGLDLVRRIIEAAPGHLAPDGSLVVEFGDARAALEASFPDLPFVWLDTADSAAEVFSLTAADLGPSPPRRPRRTSPKPARR
jgi:ribosomal protein L3 glutamine methyltransferase